MTWMTRVAGITEITRISGMTRITKMTEVIDRITKMNTW